MSDQSTVSDAAGGDAVFRVAIFSRGEDPDAMSVALQESLGLNRIDAKIHTAHIPGVLPDRLTHQQAGAAVSAVQALGVAAAAFEQSAVPELAHPETIHHAACREDGLEIIGLSGVESGFVNWDDLEFVSVGHVPLESAHHYSSEALVVVHGSPHCVDEQSEGIAVSGPVCWLIARNPQRVYFIDHTRMNYDYLGERKSSSATANFAALLTDLTSAATGAFLTPATRAILNHGSSSDYIFKDAEQLQQATLLQYLLHLTIARAQLPEHD